MRTFFSPFLSSLVVVFALFILISEEQMAPSGPGFRIDGERNSGRGEELMQALLLQSQRQSDFPAANNMEITEAQQLLKENGFYSGPLDGTMNQRTRRALRSFQESRRLNVTGRLDSDTAQELGLQATL
jgi:Putative peptidoglycan binding domain